MHFYRGYNRSHAPSPCFIGFTFQYIPLAAPESVQELCRIRSSSGPSLIGQRVTLPYRLNGHILACDALDTACQVNMPLSADEIIRNGTNIWTWCFLVLSIPLFCNPNWSKKMLSKMLRRLEKIQRKLEMWSGWDLSEFTVHCTLWIYGEPPCIIQMADALCLSLYLVHSARFQSFKGFCASLPCQRLLWNSNASRYWL